MDTPTPVIEDGQRRFCAAGKQGAIVRRVRGKFVWVERALAIHARYRSASVNSMKRGMYVLALLLLTVVVGVSGTSAAEVGGIPPTGNGASTAAMFSSGPNAGEWNGDMAMVTFARYKGH